MENEKIVILIDEDGKEKEFETIATIEVDNMEYAILLPLDEDTDEGVVFKIVEDNGEEVLEYVEDDDEFERVAQAYEKLMEEE